MPDAYLRAVMVALCFVLVLALAGVYAYVRERWAWREVDRRMRR